VAVSLITGFGSQFPEFVYRLYISEVQVVRQPALTADEAVPGSEGDIIATDGHFALRSTGFEAVKHGQVWRLITPIFLHFDILHLLFNMFWLFDLAGMIEMRRGWGRLAILVLVIGVASNVAQFEYTHRPFFGGMSGVVYGLFGYVWMKGHYEPTGTLTLRQGTINMMMLWLILCMVGVIPHVANAAHVAGLAAGMLIGIVPHLSDELRRW
jgi:membrane associated rhomboid family serine protease